VQFGARGRGGVKASRGRAKSMATASPDVLQPARHKQQRTVDNSGDDQFVITESTHLCGYPNCGKRFRFKHDLLRHQTKFHGRQPKFARGRKSMGSDEMYMAAGTDDSYGYFDESLPDI